MPGIACCALQVFNVFDKGRVQQLEGELKTLYIVNCPSLVRFYGVYKSDEKVRCTIQYYILC